MFNGNRLSAARDRRSYTKKKLAEMVSVKARTITGYESGEYPPSDQVVKKLSVALNYPVNFFFGDEFDRPSIETASFRSLARMTARQREAALSAGGVAYLINDWVEKLLHLPTCKVPEVETTNPALAAKLVRIEMGLGMKPITNVTATLEKIGVRVFSLSENCLEVDAFSVWRNNIPYVFLNTRKSAERSRFDAAHEFGHLVLHRDKKPTGKEAEREADQFAAEFLMPGDVFRDVERDVGENDIFQLKKKWKVSFSAIIYRLHHVGRMGRWSYENWMKSISIRGWRKKEPRPIEREKSILWPKVLNALQTRNLGIESISIDIHVPKLEVHELLFGIAPYTMRENPEAILTPRSKPNLRIVD